MMNTPLPRSVPLNEIWPEPDLSIIDGGRGKPPDLPLEPFGPWADWITAQAEGKSAPPDYVAATLLVVTSTLIGNSRRVSPWPGWQEPAHIWCALVGNPSSGKSPAMDAVLDPLRALETEQAAGFPNDILKFERDAETAKAKREAWQAKVKEAVKKGTDSPAMPEAAVEPESPVRPRLYLVDATIEMIARLLAAHARGLLFTRDELAGWLENFNRYNGGDRPFWVEAFGGRPYTVDRVKHAHQAVHIANLSLGVCGGIQPDRLATLLIKGDDDGLASRLLMTWPDPVPPRRPRRIADTGIALDAMRRILNIPMGTDTNGQPCPVVIPLTDEAASLFESWRAENFADEHGVSGLLLSHFGKLPGLVLRLALTIEYLWWTFDGVDALPAGVGVRSAGYAAHLVDEYFKPMARRAYGDAALPEAERHAAAMARHIQHNGLVKFSTTDIRRTWKIPSLNKADKVVDPLVILEESGWIKAAPSRAGETPGRFRADYTVNPKIHGGGHG